jgi:hemerythrin superfamily protein
MKRTQAKKKTQSSKKDIITLILNDHKPLKKMIKTLKSEKVKLAKKKEVFEEFAPTLIAHAKPEEKSWYPNLKTEHDMAVEGTEGDVEHGLADQLCEELKSTTDHDLFMAKVKVLAELVEHHIEEEEEELLPTYRKDSTIEEREKVGQKYLFLKAQYTEVQPNLLKEVA